jgi:impB/mucB/samB family C-terminal domain
MAEQQLQGRVVTLKLKTTDFAVRTRAHTSGSFVQRYEDIYAIAAKLLKAELPLRLRLMGVRVSQFKGQINDPVDPRQSSLSAFLAAAKDSGSGSSSTDSSGATVAAVAAAAAAAASNVSVDSSDGIDYDEEAVYGQWQEGDYEQCGDTLDDVHDGSSSGATAAAAAASPATAGAVDSSSLERAVSCECPVCGKVLPASNAELNRHIDLCLNGAAVKQTVKESNSRSSEERKGAGKRRRIEDFF